MADVLGFEGLGVIAWLIWMTPFIGAAFIPILRKSSEKFKSYIAVAFSIVSALLALTILPLGLSNGEIHSQIPWFSALNLEAGVLADPLAIIMSNLVAWISAAIFIYSVAYMHREKSLIRYWFFMLFFIGSLLLKAASAYVGIDMSSQATSNITKSVE